MAKDERLRRAAGVIMFHIERHDDPRLAVQKASKHEPSLSKSELQYCLDWALAGLRFQVLFDGAPDDAEVFGLLSDSGLLDFITDNQ